jgi:phosphoglucosamine mutase
MAMADDLRRKGSSEAPAEVLIGMDTRESGPWIAGRLAEGLKSRGVPVRFAGVVTTPGVAYLTRSGDFVAGVMISASHNAYQDNGLKVFGHSGYKLPDIEEHAIEQEIFALKEKGAAPERPPHSGSLPVDESLDRQYLEFLVSTVSVSFDGLRIAVDCGNGSAYRLGPELFRRLGAEVIALNDDPNGRNINLKCGALHVEGLRETVLAQGADFGVAFDGDADRAMFIARSGKLVDGDSVLLATARALKAAGRLTGDTVVSTVMANLGVEKALEREGIRMLRAQVGDKYVLEEMVRTGAVLGGEQSGHVIFHEYATTGDGLLTALRLFEIARRCGVGLDELALNWRVYPQKLVNIPVREKKPFHEIPAVAREIRAAEDLMGGSGRVLVRYSGTELLARVMVEAVDPVHVETGSTHIAEAIRAAIGA